jgi:hypothetical protein
VILKLEVQSISEQLCLLIDINMITTILLQVIELSDVLIHTVDPLLYMQEFP